MRALLEADALPAKTAVNRKRGAAVTALASLCGAGLRAQERLTGADWRPDGRDVVLLRRGDRAALRAVPLVPTARIVVERFLTSTGGRAADAPLFPTARSGARWPLHAVNADLGRACGVTFDDLRALFVGALDQAVDCAPWTLSYLIGRSLGQAGQFGLVPPPSEGAMRALLLAALPVARPWRRLTHAGGGRGPKLRSEVSKYLISEQVVAPENRLNASAAAVKDGRRQAPDGGEWRAAARKHTRALMGRRIVAARVCRPAWRRLLRKEVTPAWHGRQSAIRSEGSSRPRRR